MTKAELLFRYCTACGMASPVLHDDASLECPHCGFHYYFNSAAAVAGLISDEKGRLLITIRGREPGKGMHDLPGGFVDAGESAEDAIIREIREELNLKLTTTEYLISYPNNYLFKGVTYNTLDIAVICTAEEVYKAKVLDDVSGIIFLKPEDIKLDDFAFDSIKKIISTFLKKHDYIANN